MKWKLLALILFSSLAFGQTITTQYQFTASSPAAGTTANGGAANETNSGTQFRKITWTVTGTVATCAVQVDSSADNITYTAGGAITTQTCTSNGASTVNTGVFNFTRINVTAISGGGSVKVVYQGFPTSPGGGGSVTSISATSPIVVTPNPITGVGTVSCPTCGTSTGTVTSVGLTVNSTSPSGIFTVTGSPVTTSGTLDIDLAGTSGGIPCFTSGTVLGSSSALTANTLVKGGGAGVCPGLSGATDDGTTFTLPRLFSQSTTDTTTTLINNALLTLTLNPGATKTGSSNVLNLNQSSSMTQPVSGRMRGLIVTMTPQSTGTITRTEGVSINSNPQGTSAFGTVIGANIDNETLTTGGTTTTNEGILLQTGQAAAGGTITSDIGINIPAPSKSGTMTHHYGIIFGDQSTNTGGFNPDGWSIFDSTSVNKEQFGTVSILATLGVGSTAGGSGVVTINGGTSGSAAIGVATAAGTPAQINLPTTTGSANGLLQTNGATPQVTSWTLTPSLTTLALTGQLTSTLATGTAPFVVASTTNVANLNASSLSGATFAAPGAIGGTTPGTGAFTTGSFSGALTLGTNGGTQGTLTLNGSTSGSASWQAGTTAATLSTAAALSSAAITSSNSITAGAGNNFTFNGRTKFGSSADGLLLISNNGATDFTRMMLGGTTSSFPAIKRNATALNFRLADDSADAPVTMGSTTIGGGTPILKVLSATATLDFANQAAIGCNDLTITVTGAATGDTTDLGVPNGSVVNGTAYFTAWVSAANTVTVRYCNLISGDPASGTFRATVTQF